MVCLSRVFNRRTVLPVAAFLVALWTGAVWAQTSSQQFSASDWAKARAAWRDALDRGASMEELERLDAELEKFEDDDSSPILGRTSSILDRAFGYVWVSNLEHRIHNFNHQGRDGISCEYYPRPDGNRYPFHRMVTVGVGVPEGAWGNAQVLENSDYYVAHEVGDWEALDGSRGLHFADPPATRFDYPLMAITTLEATWPSDGWPAPEGVEEVWYGTETWYKWKRVSEMEYYGEFTDQEAGRDGSGESYSLGITAKFRSMAYGAIDAVLVQYEFTNTSSNTYTDTYIGLQYYRAFPGRIGTYYGFPRWDPGRQLLYCVGRNYDPATGYHTDSGGTEFSWGGYVYLQSPTGSWRLDPVTADTTDSPSTVVTRLPLFHGSDRPTQSDHEWGMYATMSGDISLYEDPTIADNIWKHITQGAGQPILMQNENHWFPYWFGALKPADTDPALETLVASRGSYGFHFVSSGPFTWAPGESIDYCVAFVAAQNESALLEVADRAIRSYQNQFQWSGPPPIPADFKSNGPLAGPFGLAYDNRIHAYPIYYPPVDNVILTWDLSESLAYRDPITLNFDFQGIRLYRSSDLGQTWGNPITDSRGNRIGWAPFAQYDLIDGITGDDPISHVFLGEDTGLATLYTDRDVVEGIEYWYAITAYGYAPPDPSYESRYGDNPFSAAMIALVPSTMPSTFQPGELVHDGTTGSSISLLSPVIADRGTSIGVQVIGPLTGDSYSLSVSGYYVDNYGASITTHGGIQIRNVTIGTDLFNNPVQGGLPLQGINTTPVTDGFMANIVEPNYGDGGVYSFEITTDMSDTTNYTVSMQQAYMEASGSSANRANRTGFMNDVELRFTGWVPAAGDTNWIVTRSGGGYSNGDRIQCPFEVWDIETNTRLMPVTYWPGQPFWDGYLFVVTNVPYYETDGVTVTDFSALHPVTDTEYWNYDTSNPNSRSDWVYRFRFNEITYSTNEDYWDVGDVWTLKPYKTLKAYAGQSYDFSTTAATNEAPLAELAALIRVVPNPCYISSSAGSGDHKIQFINIPDNSTIDIYTVSGELVVSLSSYDHYVPTQTGTVEWDLRSFMRDTVAYGLYIYVVKAEDGKVQKVGKLAIIR